MDAEVDHACVVSHTETKADHAHSSFDHIRSVVDENHDDRDKHHDDHNIVNHSTSKMTL